MFSATSGRSGNCRQPSAGLPPQGSPRPLHSLYWIAVFWSAAVLLALFWCAPAALAVQQRSRAPRLELSVAPAAVGKGFRYGQGEAMPFKLALLLPGPSRRPASRPRGRLDVLPVEYRGWNSFVSFRCYQVHGRGRKQVLEKLDWRSLVGRYNLARSSIEAREPGRAVVQFALPPETAAQLVPGDYEAEARLDTRKASQPQMWKGEAAAPRVSFTIYRVAGSEARGRLLAGQARFAFDNRNSARALRLAREATRLAPKYLEGWYLLGLAASARRDWPAAIEGFQKYLALGGPDEPEPGKRPPVSVRLAHARKCYQVLQKRR